MANDSFKMEAPTCIQSSSTDENHNSSTKDMTASNIEPLPEDEANNNSNSSLTNKARRNRPGRSKSTGTARGVRQLLSGQWSQRLQSHLKNKMDKGPSTHEPTGSTSNGNNSSSKIGGSKSFDGEASNTDLLLLTAGEAPQDRRNLSSSRFEQSITLTGEILSNGSSWLLSPKRRSSLGGRDTNSNNNSQNQNSYSNPHTASYNNLNNSDPESHHDKTTNNSQLYQHNNSSINRYHSSVKSTGSSSTIFGGVNDFLNMPSEHQIDTSMNSQTEFDILRQPPTLQKQQQQQQQQQKQSPPKPPSTSRLSIFGKSSGNNNGTSSRPALAPKITKQLTDFRLRRQGKDPKEINKGTAHFSVTSEKLSAHSIDSRLGDDDHDDDDDNQSLQDDLDPVRSPMDVDIDTIDIDNNHNSSSSRRNRKLGGSLGDFQQVENLLASQIIRYELKKDIECQQKQRFSGAGTSDTGQGMMMGKAAAALWLEKEKLQAEANNTGRKPRRAQSTSARTMRRSSSLPKDIDQLTTMEQQVVKTITDNLNKDKGDNRNVEDIYDDDITLDDLFDDDDSVFFGNKAGGKKQVITTSTVRSTGSIGNTAKIMRKRSSEAEDVATSFASRFANLPNIKLSRARTTSSMDEQRRMAASISVFPAVSPPSVETSARSHRTTGTAGSSQRSHRTTGGGSSRSERTTGGSTTVSRGSCSLRSQQSFGSATSGGNASKSRPRRVSDLEQSFQITADGGINFGDDDTKEGGDDESNANSSTGRSVKKKSSNKKRSKKSEVRFHQSFALDALVTPVRQKKGSIGSSLPNLMASITAGNFLEDSFAMLSTVEEMSVVSRKEQEERRPKRRNSLPTASTHGQDSVKELISPKSAAGKPKVSPEAGESTSGVGRRRRRHSLSSEMGASSHNGSTSSRRPSLAASSMSSRSRQMPEEEEDERILATANKMFGIAPSKADAQTRRRVSVKVQEIVKPEPKESQVDKIRMRRRVSAKLPMKPRLSKGMRELTAMVNEAQDVKPTNASQRPKGRRSRRQTSLNQETAGISDALKRSMTHEGVAVRHQEDPTETGPGDETKKKASTPNSSTPRRTRRRSVRADSSPATPNTPNERKERAQNSSTERPSPRIPVFNEATTARLRGSAGVTDESQPGRTTPSTRRQLRPRRQTSMETEATDNNSDDESLEPTPMPVAPPSLPKYDGRGTSMSPGPGLVPRRKGTRPRRKTSVDGSPATPVTPSVRKEQKRIFTGPRFPVFDDEFIVPPRQPSSGRPRRQTNAETETETTNDSDDESLEPTPMPAAPPTLPKLATRGRSKSPVPGSRRKSSRTRPRRKKSNDSISKANTVESRQRRQKSSSASPKIEESDAVTPAARRKTRNRRHTAHEALKDMEAVLSPGTGPSSKVVLGAPSESMLSEKEAKAKRTIDKQQLMAELCHSPYANRLKRRNKSKEEEVGTATKEDKTTPKTPRRTRRSKSDEGDNKDTTTNQTKSRRRRTEISEALTPQRRLRRVKTVDSVVTGITSIDLDDDATKVTAEGKDVAAGEATLESDATSTAQQGAEITSKNLLNGLVNF